MDRQAKRDNEMSISLPGLVKRERPFWIILSGAIKQQGIYTHKSCTLHPIKLFSVSNDWKIKYEHIFLILHKSTKPPRMVRRIKMYNDFVNYTIYSSSECWRRG